MTDGTTRNLPLGNIHVRGHGGSAVRTRLRRGLLALEKVEEENHSREEPRVDTHSQSENNRESKRGAAGREPASSEE